MSIVEKAYEVGVPDRLKQFYLNKQAPAKHLKLQAGYLRGRFRVDFEDEVLLDLNELGENYWIDAIMAGGDIDGQWKDLMGQCVPLATLEDVAAEGADDEHDEGGHKPVKAFLVVDTAHEQCPVLVFDYECSAYPLADSLDGFLRGEPPKDEGRFTQEGARWGLRYRGYSWADPNEADGKDDYPNNWLSIE